MFADVVMSPTENVLMSLGDKLPLVIFGALVIVIGCVIIFIKKNKK